MGLLALAVATLLGLVSATLAEVAENKTRLCQPAPRWEINGTAPMTGALGRVTFCLNLGGLREKLSQDGLADISYMIVNEKTPLSRAMFWELKRWAPEEVPVYQQEILEPDVWQILDGDKDDFLIYDRCGRLAFHIPLPYSFLHFRYVESAVRFTYTKDVCGNCSLYSNSTWEVRSSSRGSHRAPVPFELTHLLPLAKPSVASWWSLCCTPGTFRAAAGRAAVLLFP
uniref:Selenoprotein P N-terminal domain-containing protein n=1 Tax=Gopherus agassizii TaxID=38772 RepID=A0A452IWN6_9SAUR